MSDFTVGPLAQDEARAVYPLIREAIPTLQLATWLRFTRQVAATRPAGHAGIVVARRTGRLFPCGLFCYRVERDLEHGQVLTADHFVAMDLLDPTAVLDALVNALQDLGAQLGCSAVRGIVHGRQTALAGELSAAGHALEASLFSRSVAPVGAAAGAGDD